MSGRCEVPPAMRCTGLGLAQALPGLLPELRGQRFGLVDARCGSMQFAPSLAARFESCVPQQPLTFQDHFEPIDTNDAQAAPQPYWDVRNTHRSLTPFANLL